MKIDATASYKAVPSMLMVAPTGSTKRATSGCTLAFSSRQSRVMGRVAELLKQIKICENRVDCNMYSVDALQIL